MILKEKKRNDLRVFVIVANSYCSRGSSQCNTIRKICNITQLKNKDRKVPISLNVDRKLSDRVNY